MTKLATWTPRLLGGLAIVHIVFGFAALTPNPFVAMARDGFFDSVAGHDNREAALWFVATGFAWLGWAELLRWTVRETGRIPARVGGWLLGTSIPMLVLEPVSGVWLAAALGIAALVAARKAVRA